MAGGRGPPGFQSPSLRGSGRFRPRAPRRRSAPGVSIPFIAGQWSLPIPPYGGMGDAGFQSPSLRGSGRFPPIPPKAGWGTPGFQSPSLRGSGRFGVPRPHPAEGGMFQSPSLRGSGRFQADAEALIQRLRVSIPFIAGQWSLRSAPRCTTRRNSRFNPLHCGAVVASEHAARREAEAAAFQSPSLRGSGRFEGKR